MHPYGSLPLLSISFPLSSYISYTPPPLSSLPLSTFFVHFSLIYVYTCHSFCAFFSGLLSFSPYFFLFPSVSPHLSPSLAPASPFLSLSFLSLSKANTASPCPQSKTLLCPLSTVLESHCRPAAQYAQWPRGPTMAHFNLNFPRNEWEPTPVHAACLLIGPS